MDTLKKEALRALASLPDTANVDDMMYRLYVIDRIRKGEKNIAEGKTISHEKLVKKSAKW